MQILLPVLVALAPGPAPDIAQALAESTRRAEVEAAENQAALAAAYQRLSFSRLLTEGHVVVIRRVGKFIVVSTIQTNKNVRGGRAHAVFDPATGKIVHVLGED